MSKKIMIVGGGLAAASILDILYRNNFELDIYSDFNNGASHISSGIINPLSGRNLVLNDNFLEIEKRANEIYNHDSSKRFLSPVKVLKTIEDDVCFSNLLLKSDDYKDWYTILDKNKIIINRAYQLNINSYIDYILPKAKNIFDEKIDYSLIIQDSNSIIYKEKYYDYIIFAEGIKVYDNPFFNYLPFQAVRGEAILLNTKERIENVIHEGKFICNFKDNLWVGSTFERVNHKDNITTLEARNTLEQKAKKILNKNIETKAHLGAMRCSTHDRIPFVDFHFKFKRMLIFNGFGTKGASLIPYYCFNVLNLIQNGNYDQNNANISRVKSDKIYKVFNK